MSKIQEVTTEQLLRFIANEDFLLGSHTGQDVAICKQEQREQLAILIRAGKPPRVLIGQDLADMLRHHPDFSDALAQCCTVVAVDNYEGVEWVDTYYIAFHQ